MLSLIQKELWSVRPFIVFIVCFIGIGLVIEFTTSIPHLQDQTETVQDYIACRADAAIIVLVLSIAFCTGLFVREYDDQTIEFLDALPTSRSRIFFAKAFVAWLLVLLFIATDIGAGWFLYGLSRNSLRTSWHVPYVAAAFGLRVIQGTIIVCLAIAFSLFRRFGWLALGLVLFAYLAVRERLPSIEILDFSTLAVFPVDFEFWSVSWDKLKIQCPIAFGLFAFSYLLFLGRVDVLLRLPSRLKKTRLGAALLLGSVAMIVVVFCGVIFLMMNQDVEEFDIDDYSNVDFPSWKTSQRKTNSFEFVYPTDFAQRANDLMASSDEVHERVRGFFQAEQTSRILVDMSRQLPRHAGLAHWNQVIIDLSDFASTEKLASILAHETAHVYLNRISDNRLAQKFPWTRSFHEGAASYVEYHLFSTPKALERSRIPAAFSRARNDVKIKYLFDDAELRRFHDPNLAYPLGEVFVSAIVESYGTDAVHKIARAFVREESRDLSRLTLWQDAFQACGFNLEKVIDGFFAILDREVEKHLELIESLPKIEATFNVIEGFLWVVLTSDAAEGWSFACRFRNSSDASDRFFVPGTPDAQTSFFVDLNEFSNASIGCQLGFHKGDQILYEPWQEIPIRSTRLLAFRRH